MSASNAFTERFYFRGPDQYVITGAGSLVCQICGCLVMEGHRDAHNYQHQLVYNMAAALSGLAGDVIPEVNP